MEKIREPKLPQGLIRWFYRFPLIFFRLGLGRWMGGRFMHLIHTGRVSGLRREAVVEVVEYEAEADIYFLASCWGKRSDWLRNIQKTPEVEAQVGVRKFMGYATVVNTEKAAEIFTHYGERHPGALQALARVMGYRINASEESYRALGAEIPVVQIKVNEGI